MSQSQYSEDAVQGHKAGGLHTQVVRMQHMQTREGHSVRECCLCMHMTY